MKIKCGIDIIEISRIKENIENLGEKFINRIYTENEIEYCERKNSQKYQHYAARFAAKESLFKAISECLENKYEIAWKDIEVINDINGRPQIKIKNQQKYNIQSMDISISHSKEYAIAYIVIILN